MSIGIWWFVYPREITSAVFIALAAMPDLPRQWWLRLPMLAVFAVLVGKAGFLTATHWDEFEKSDGDFRAIVAQVPRAPKLMYLVFDHSGSPRRVTPYIHMPAWVQAQKGGWLSFHFAGWGDFNPIRYRPPGPNVPPATPDRWEWTPDRFDLKSNGCFLRYVSHPQHALTGLSVHERCVDSTDRARGTVVAVQARRVRTHHLESASKHMGDPPRSALTRNSTSAV